VTISAAVDNPPLRLKSLQVAAEEIESHPKTLRRMALQDPDFPSLIRINSRDFFDAFAWENYKRRLMARGLGRRAG
jgi:hypothetical protein